MPHQQQYVLCPSCGDPVPGPFPQAGEFVQCPHCRETFPFDTDAVEAALIEYQELDGRWTVVPVHREIDSQAARILNFCHQSVPDCIVHIRPIGSDSFTLKVRDCEGALIDSDLCLHAHELAAMSDDELWKLLRTVSNNRVRRKP